ncbi:DUF924 family protein [Pseudoxanthomonas wuyuanensis]|uniref:Uncharacterized conserved protein, DUF924 family n=1 Tax=Pseudoxanthomonas wuyuanensis TaxID=1073196 RepID=A0A286DAC2_9GAMM|nr:DUF924 family protein [Pseudoxanthomonas wuyuanensis]KAF1720556.1 DUF924 domain-containing protein [Pseudoxanthomonas wuyuanensis]SOD55606.1 Uncharacterized conserved protein, DUF924 family [Pseudoxanthomonas wuyuanensis]
MSGSVAPGPVVDFWREAGYEKWFANDDAFDAAFDQGFRELHFRAARRELEDWMSGAEGALALVLLLDQFPRNCFRGSAHSYATDGLARHYADRAVASGYDRQVVPALRIFFYMPFEHSESLQDQQRSLDLFGAVGDDNYLKYAQLHYDIIERFGRFPHRNRALGRESTQEEVDYLANGGFSG